MQVKSIAECSEHSTILLTFIKLPFVIKIFVLSIFVWPFYAGFTVDKKSNIALLGIAYVVGALVFQKHLVKVLQMIHSPSNSLLYYFVNFCFIYRSLSCDKHRS